MGVWKYEMTKRLPDITHQVSVLKIHTHITDCKSDPIL